MIHSCAGNLRTSEQHKMQVILELSEHKNNCLKSKSTMLPQAKHWQSKKSLDITPCVML
jgi:hypothetical protein